MVLIWGVGMISRDLFGYPILPKIDIVRVPYMGSKKAIAIMLFKSMLDLKPNAKYFVDLFGGGGTMAFTAHQIGLKVIYNEKQTSLVNFIQYIFDRIKSGERSKFGIFPEDFYKFIDREEFIRVKNENSIYGQFARICYSFGNNQKNYLFAEIESLKKLGHNIVIYQCKKSLEEFNQLTNSSFILSTKKNWNERRLDFMRQFSRERRDKKEEQLQQLEQLGRLQQLEELGRLQQLDNIRLFNLDYKDVIIDTPREETIVYLDPPYRGTGEYLEKGICYDELDNYFRNSLYTCFMSEYDAPFKSVMEIEKRSLMNNSKNSKKYTIEHLYINS